MKHMLPLLAALFVVCILLPAAPASARETPGTYQVITPAGYEDDLNRRYPVIYLLPQDGYAADGSGLDELLTQQMDEQASMKMIIVKPVFSPDTDVISAMSTAIAEIDQTYRTVAMPECRIALGTGAGGYLAYTLLLADGSTFGAAASIRGDFASEENPWLPKYGSIREKLETIHHDNRQLLDSVFTYMDAPVDDPWTDLPGSTDDLGALMIGFGTGSASHEFTARPGAYSEDFAAESVKRVLNRMTQRIFGGAVTGSVKPSKSVLTSEDTEAEILCTVNVSDDIRTFSEGEIPMIISLELTDPAAGESIAVSGMMEMIPGPREYTQTLTLTNDISGSSANVRMSVSLMDTALDVASATLIRVQDPLIDGESQQIDLMGDWHFQYVGARTALDAAHLDKAAFEAWPVVQPGLTSWEKGFGNISDENVQSGYGPDYFNFFITGNGYYARTFTLPEEFDTQEPVLVIGYVDDRCEVFLNGQRVGATGLNEQGQPTGDTTWAIFSHFEVDPALLNTGGENTIVVRAWNDLPYGVGGWYGGPIGLYSKTAFDAQWGSSASARFYEETFDSACAARMSMKQGTIENKYLIYLPESYFTSGRFYPTVYLLHQFNSDHTSYRTDHVDQLLDEGVRAGLFDEMIVVIPNSSEESWWRGEWEKMITDELIPHIDGKYRTIPDARFRLTAGCSMGGQGAYSVALRNPDFFTGAVSFFGAFSYGGESSPTAIAAKEPAEYLRNYALYFSCGNQDSYGFGQPAIQLHKQLNSLGVEHAFLIENGGHDSAFYLPRFQDALAYVRSRMYRSNPEMDAFFSGALSLQDGTLHVRLTADPDITNYLYTAPASSFTRKGTQDLQVTLTMKLQRNGETIKTLTARDALNADTLTIDSDFALDSIGQTSQQTLTAVCEAAVLDRIIPLGELKLSAQ